MTQSHKEGGEVTRSSDVTKAFDFVAIYNEARKRFTDDATNPVCIDETIAKVAFEHGVRLAASTPSPLEEVEKLREHIAEQITHVEQRIRDGAEMGASIWRIALEDVVRENRVALLTPSADPHGEVLDV